MYNKTSHIAEDFINDEEIQLSLQFAKDNKNNLDYVRDILKRAREYKGISHRDAITLLECEDKEILEETKKLAMEIKEKFYGNRIVLFAPLYLSNYCVNGCVYCPYHYKNKHIRRKKLTQQEIVEEVMALQDMGHKRLALETGEDPINNPIEYVLE